MGKSAPRIRTSPYETAMADIAQRQQRRAEQLQTGFEDPLRNQMQPQIAQALGQNPFSTKLSAADRAAYEGQFNQAKQNLMNTAAPGGLMRSQMAGLERDRANAISGAASAARQTGLQRALGASAGVLPGAQLTNAMSGQALQGLSGANQTAAQRLMQQAGLNEQAASSKGSGLGSLAGLGIKGLMK